MFIRHIIKQGNKTKMVDLRHVLYKECSKCKKDIADTFFGIDDHPCVAKSMIIYKQADVVEELLGYSGMKGVLNKKCNGCKKV
jgi:hypothetical protein